MAANKKTRKGPAGAKRSKNVVKKTAGPPAPERTQDERRPLASKRTEHFPVVALGASAGGLAALEAFFTSVSGPTGMAYVVITHQQHKQPSLLAELLARRTSMPVTQLSAPTRLEADHVYTVKPGHQLAVHERTLVPIEIVPGTQVMPIDFFFRSLARDLKEWAIAVVLSGTGTDGSIGIKEIKSELGMVLAQEEGTAEYSGMPHSAITTDLVDHVLPVAAMPDQIRTYAKALRAGRSLPPAPEAGADELRQVFALIRERSGHDFSNYKESTVRRRIERRMNVHDLDSLKRYVRYLQTNPNELDTLFQELLIGVTSFFRDPEAWDALGDKLDELIVSKPDDYVFRAWVTGCSTGEEAYSLAILLKERIERLKRPIVAQIFATDLDAVAIDVARAGEYPLGITSDVTEQRLSRFFNRHENGYTMKREVREMVVFAPQNLIGDPPFTKLDLLSCRNLLIYLDTSMQRKLLPIFHYALKPQGILFLGSSESIGGFGDLFSALDKKWKLFRRNDGTAGKYPTDFPVTKALEVPLLGSVRPLGRAEGEVNLAHAAERLLLKQLVPPTVIISKRGDVAHIHGRTGLFLEPAPGPQGAANIFNMAREGLQISLSAAIREASTTDAEVVHRGVPVRTNGDVHAVNLRVHEIRDPEALRGYLRITFEDVGSVEQGPATPSEHVAATRLLDLERELQYTKESHQGTIEELETANEELKSTNEELQSANEELQSANEELETSKEEMHSLNEELQTVNAELQEKVEELSRANNDMKNLLNGTDIATVFVDNALNIKRFTEQAKRVIRLIPTDIGRHIGDLVSTLSYDRLVEDARDVLTTLVFREKEVQGEGGTSYLMRILPYRTTDNVIDGLVLTFVDITKVRRLQENQERLARALDRSPTCVFGQDVSLRYQWAYAPVFGKRPGDVEGKTDAEVFPPEVARVLTDFKRAVLESGSPNRGRITLPLGGQLRSYDLYAEPVRSSSGGITGISGVVTDIT